MSSPIINKLKHLRLGYLLAISLAATEVLSALVVSGISLLRWGTIRYDSLLTGAVASMIVATIIVSVILLLLRDLRTTEGNLRESQERYSGIIENIQEGYYELDLAGNLVFFSDPICSILGYSREEILGTNIRCYADPTAKKTGTDLFNGVYTTGEPAKGFDWKVVRKDGSRAHVEASVSLLTDSEGRGTGFRGIIRDVTERKQSEEALRQSEEKARAILNAITEAVVLIDPRGTVLAGNAVVAERLGTTLSELIGRSLYDFFPPDLAKSRREAAEKAIQHGRPVRTEDERDGRTYDTNWYPVFNSRGDVVHVAVFAADITETRRLQVQLQHAQKMEAIGTLAGGIAHNFNNLLMAIQGNASLMLMDTSPDHPHYKRLKSIEQQIRNGSRLTTQLLGYAREGTYEIRPVNLNSIVRETSETFAQAKREIQVHLDLCEDLSGVVADQGQLEQVLLNLYVNAADAMQSGGELLLKTTNVTHREIAEKTYAVRPGKYVCLSVKDTGTGMDEKTMERIFEPFFTTKRIGEGTGLGLASVYGIVKGHRGYIDVESRPGRGTTFELLFPANGKNVPMENRASGSGLSRGKGTVLLIDDEEDIHQVAEDIIRTLGYHVLVAGNGQDALEIYRESRKEISLVLLDMIMPGMGGGETFDCLKAINPEVKVLLFSGYSINGKAQEIMARGCNGFLQKPFRIEELHEKIRRIMGQN
ncbi:MAG: PAS domain S-box protein [Deltaproteobacteria bacterium]|nr:PAS domain S-box protein [Deltaproteobacteria bacterium]